jgi:HlyD family secretion protein
VAQTAQNTALQRTDAAAASPTAAAATSARATGPRSVAVKRDSITRSLSIEGSVVPQAQVPITYPIRATVADIKVKAGQAVEEGDVLIEMDPVEIKRSLTEARTRLQSSQLALAQAFAQVSARQQSAAQQAALDQRQQQLAVADATTGLRHAQENLDRVMAGASITDRRAAQDSLDKAQGTLEKAQAAYDKLAAGPDQAALRAAQRDVATNQIAVTKLQTELDTLTGGPDPAAVRTAQGDLQRAQTQLQIAQTSKIDPKTTDPAVAQIQHDAAIQDAQLAVQAALARLERLKQPPAAADVQSARQKLQDAQDTLQASKDKLSTLQEGPDEVTLQVAQAAVDKADQGVSDAQKQVALIESHPTPAEIADARDQIRKAQTALDAAQRGSAFAPGPESAVDLDALQGAVDQDQATVGSLEQALEDTRLKAPFAATIVTVRVKIGDPVTSSKPVILLSKPGAPLLQLDLDDTQVKLLSVGQQASARFESDGSTPFDAKVVSVTPAALDGSTGAVATVQVKWGDTPPPKFGTLLSVNIMLEQKADVLVVPKGAVRQLGGRASVEVQDGGLRRLVPVQVGIQSDTSVEIISGVNEGQMVLVAGG